MNRLPKEQSWNKKGLFVQPLKQQQQQQQQLSDYILTKEISLCVSGRHTMNHDLIT
jgi:hypothetical protein